MGKGDKKSRRGKISMGSHGVTRPRVSNNLTVPKPKAAESPAAEDKA